MSTEDPETLPKFLRQAEMMRLLRSEEDPITSHLMQVAVNSLFLHWSKKRPISDFDGNFFIEVIQDFCRQHDILKLILTGEGEKLAWFPDEEDG